MVCEFRHDKCMCQKECDWIILEHKNIFDVPNKTNNVSNAVQTSAAVND